MKINRQLLPGLILSLAIAVPAHFLGQAFPIIGGPVFAILMGMIIALFWTAGAAFQPGIRFSSKVLLQAAVVLLGFGLNLSVVIETGLSSLPIILSTISIALLVAFIFSCYLNIDTKTATLVGVGSSICGGSAIAATAPVIEAEEEEVAQAISVIFFFNVLAALIFPSLGQWLGFDTTTGEAFGIFAGTAVNDTSSVTAAASTWDSLFNLGTETLDKAITVKLTRTLAIIPITLGLSFWRSRHGEETPTNLTWGQKIKASLPQFIIYFVLASLLTTICLAIGLPESLFAPFKWASKFLIVWAMAAIGLNTDLAKLLRSGASALGLGAACWIAITLVSLGLQYVLGFW